MAMFGQLVPVECYIDMFSPSLYVVLIAPLFLKGPVCLAHMSTRLIHQHHGTRCCIQTQFPSSASDFFRQKGKIWNERLFIPYVARFLRGRDKQISTQLTVHLCQGLLTDGVFLQCYVATTDVSIYKG